MNNTAYDNLTLEERLAIVKKNPHKCSICGNNAGNPQYWELDYPILIDENHYDEEHHTQQTRTIVRIQKLNLCESCAGHALRFRGHKTNDEAKDITWNIA
ncbi:hypothetical protein [Bifidobacterium callitrichidarum]|uniref:Uncharacterized protein n=1 Tax=Bifidobacterium callitrichidarum TaxID=2052941 RepID=A0A2U2N971_9BIFI|nr:hypothetical protein [Bifidobacterium callitrichidarum]PWG65648.1 hypothetical protein DF196_06865 [Bifidobacterium callitrichidarum]